MTPVNPDQTTVTTAALLTSPPSTGREIPVLGLDASAGNDTSAQGSVDVQARIKQFTDAMHQAIDWVEQGLASKAADLSATPSKYVGQVREYGDQAREKVTTSPLQAVGIAIAAGIVYDQVFSSRPQRVVEVEVPASPSWDLGGSTSRFARRWADTASSRAQDLAEAGQGLLQKVGAAAGVGVASTRSMASDLTSDLPDQLRRATQRLVATSQDYGSMARSGVQAHPMVGLGAITAAGALLATLLLQRRDDGHDAFAGSRVSTGTMATSGASADASGARGVIAARPVTSAVAILGIGALLGALLSRQ